MNANRREFMQGRADLAGNAIVYKELDFGPCAFAFIGVYSRLDFLGRLGELGEDLGRICLTLEDNIS